MKKSTFSLTAILALALIVSLPACEKEGPAGPAGPQGEEGTAGPNGAKGDKGVKGDKGATGAKGPAGPKGATGAKGATGPKGTKGDKGTAGPKGAKGDPGTANVIYSDWRQVYKSMWKPNVYRFYYDFFALKLTADIKNQGQILVYMKTDISAPVYQLPYSPVYITGNAFNFAASTYNIRIHLYQPDGSIPDNSSNFYFRYVLIPGGVNAKVKVDWGKLPYAEAKQLLNLKD